MSNLTKKEGGKLNPNTGKVTPGNAGAKAGKVKLFDLKDIPKGEFAEKSKAQPPKPGPKK